MKAYVVAILVGVVLISVVSVALATNLGPSHVQNNTKNISQPTHINRHNVAPLDVAFMPSSLDLPMGVADVTLGTVIQEAIVTALLAIGSIAVLRKK
jgi:hypothetical protein